MLDRGPSLTRQNGNARRLRSKHLLAVHLNDASICTHGRLWITGVFMNWSLIVAILLISTLPLYAQGQAPDAAKLKADAQKVVTIISSDTAKFHSYCQIVDLADEIEGAKQEQDSKKAKELSAKINDLEKKLGPEYLALAASLKGVDPNSSDAQEINSILEELDESCGD